MADANHIRELLDMGLSHYGMGKVQEALATWRQVLAVDPRNSRALEYIRFVEQNWGPPTAKPAGGNSSKDESYQPPVQPVVQGSQWGDLYGIKLGAAVAVEPALRPAAKQGPVSAVPATTEQVEPPRPPPPINPAVAPSSTLPPHPTVVVPNPLPQTEGALPLQVSDFERLGPTKRYESVPTAVATKTKEGMTEPEFVVPAPILPFGEPYAGPQGQQGLPQGRQSPPPDHEPVPPCSAPGLFDVCEPTEATVPATPRFEAEFQAPVVFTDLGSPLDLVAPPPPPEVDSWLRGAQDLLALDDFTGAIDLLDKVLGRDPLNAQAAQKRAEAEKKLVAMLSSKLGDLNALPSVRMKADEIIWLNLDQRAGFVLSMVDGRTSFEDILTVCGMPQLDILRILVQLVSDKVIGT